MTSDASDSTDSSVLTAPPRIARQIALVLGSLVALAGLLIGTGVFGGTSIGDVGGGDLAPDSSLVVPAGIAFSIWTPIYLGLVVLGIWQALPAQWDGPTGVRISRVTWPLLVSMVANTAWILVAQAELTWLAVAVIFVILVSLVTVYVALVADRPATRLEAWLLDGTVGLYLGWVTVASIANVSTSLVASGYDDLAPGATFWAVAMLAIAGVIGVLATRFGRGRLGFSVSVVWALCWVVVARLTGEAHSVPAAVTAGLAALAVAATAVGQLRRRPVWGSR